MKEKIIVALDVSDRVSALRLAEQLRGEVGMLKVGLELYTREGPSLVKELRAEGHEVFLDLKLHDIPNTVAKAAAAAAALDVKFLTIHASGGPAMNVAAVQAVAGSKTQILAVTVLTSLSEEDLAATGVARSPAAQVLLLGEMAYRAGVRGLVCSPHEIGVLKTELGSDITLVTPGIRPAAIAVGGGAHAADQKRTLTPAAALNAGASYLVIGRPITAAANPAQAAKEIAQSMES